MKLRMSIAAAGAAALVGTGAFVLPAAFASAHSATHTLKFTSVEKNSVDFSKTTFGVQDTDVSKGKTVGFDEIYFKGVSATSAAANVTVDTKGGFLYGTFKVNTNTGKVTGGRVTGGTGPFKHATGTLKAVAINAAGTRHAVTIVYHT